MDALPFRFDRHVYLPALNLWLDSTTPRPFGFVSHAHSDHAARHRKVLLSATTRAFYQHRMGSRAARWGAEAVALPFHTPLAVGGNEVELLPSGHVLGSAQLAIRWADGTRLVYTGDFKLRAGPTAEAATVPHCDALIMEATFGQPRYHFPSLDEICERLYMAIDRALADGRVPTVLAYSLGKAQQATHLLAQRGYRVLVHPAVAAINRLYAAQGTDLGPWEEYRPHDVTGSVIVCPPQAKLALPTSNGTEPRLLRIMLTGWGIDPRARYRYGVDEVIPLSDHADWPELLEYVERAAPRRVFTVHGFPHLASYLRSQGIEATHLPDHQATLFDGW